MIADADAECRRDGVGGDVVMGGADAAGGDDEIIGSAQGIEGGDDLAFHIRHHARLFQVDAAQTQEPGDIVDIGILGAAGEDFIPDHQHGGSPAAFGFEVGGGFVHGRSGV